MNKNQKVLNLVLIVRDDSDRAFYGSLLATYQDISLESYTSLQQFWESLEDRLYSGVLIDLHTLIISSTSEKEFYYSIRKGFPVIRLNRSADKKELDFFIEEQKARALKGKELLDYFIYNLCASRSARKIRRHARKNLYFNVNLHFTDGHSIKTNLLDLSQGGCFVLTNEEPPADKIVYLIINELTDKTPIPAEVKWNVPWGKTIKHLPGLGLAFKKMLTSQIEEIKKALES